MSRTIQLYCICGTAFLCALCHTNAPINANPVGGGGGVRVQAIGGGLMPETISPVGLLIARRSRERDI